MAPAPHHITDKETTVCLDCRRSARMITCTQPIPICPDCRKPMVRIGKYWRIPKRNNNKGWDILRQLVEKALARGLSANYYLSANWKQNLTKQI